MTIVPREENGGVNSIWISEPEGRTNAYADPDGRFVIVGADHNDPREYLRMDAYSAAMAFVNGEFEIHGDLFAAVRDFSRQHHSVLRQAFFAILARIGKWRSHELEGTRGRSSRNIRFHYDLSNEFYALVLDSRMLYSAAHFSSPDESLEDAQLEKLDRICGDLRLAPGDRLLDIGCGWGGLVTYAAAHHSANAFGCTLAEKQLGFARQTIVQQRLTESVAVELCDYRDLEGEYDKIASIGMFEHVGQARLERYFRKVTSLLRPGGRFLNRGIVRPPFTNDGPDTYFIQRNVFPGGELVHLDDVIRQGERAGLTAIGLSDLRMHYALTCRAWVKNLERNAAKCRALVGGAAYRTWLLYLAGSAVAFQDGRISAAQVVFTKPPHA